MKILMISNSFGVNLQTYASQIAKANGYSLDIYVLYIGGCSLETHRNNILTNEKAYELFVNGVSTHKMVSILETLHMDKWDYISLQQASHCSGYLASYYPYFEIIYNYIKKECPNSKIMFHKTWAYSGKHLEKYQSTKANIPFFTFNNDIEMKKAIDECYQDISNKFHIDLLIDSGTVVERVGRTCDCLYDEQGFHMSDKGCYLIGSNLILKLFGNLPKIYYPDSIKKECVDKLYKLLLENYSS